MPRFYRNLEAEKRARKKTAEQQARQQARRDAVTRHLGFPAKAGQRAVSAPHYGPPRQPSRREQEREARAAGVQLIEPRGPLPSESYAPGVHTRAQERMEDVQDPRVRARIRGQLRKEQRMRAIEGITPRTPPAAPTARRTRQAMNQNPMTMAREGARRAAEMAAALATNPHDMARRATRTPPRTPAAPAAKRGAGGPTPIHKRKVRDRALLGGSPQSGQTHYVSNVDWRGALSGNVSTSPSFAGGGPQYAVGGQIMPGAFYGRFRRPIVYGGPAAARQTGAVGGYGPGGGPGYAAGLAGAAGAPRAAREPSWWQKARYNVQMMRERARLGGAETTREREHALAIQAGGATAAQKLRETTVQGQLDVTKAAGASRKEEAEIRERGAGTRQAVGIEAGKPAQEALIKQAEAEIAAAKVKVAQATPGTPEAARADRVLKASYAHKIELEKIRAEAAKTAVEAAKADPRTLTEKTLARQESVREHTGFLSTTFGRLHEQHGTMFTRYGSGIVRGLDRDAITAYKQATQDSVDSIIANPRLTDTQKLQTLEKVAQSIASHEATNAAWSLRPWLSKEAGGQRRWFNYARLRETGMTQIMEPIKRAKAKIAAARKKKQTATE